MTSYQIKNLPDQPVGQFKSARECAEKWFNTYAVVKLSIGWMDVASGMVLQIEEVTV